MSERYCTACDEPLLPTDVYSTMEHEEFCDQCGADLERPVKHEPISPEGVTVIDLTAPAGSLEADVERQGHR